MDHNKFENIIMMGYSNTHTQKKTLFLNTKLETLNFYWNY
jgi:hypothetical protein